MRSFSSRCMVLSWRNRSPKYWGYCCWFKSPFHKVISELTNLYFVHFIKVTIIWVLLSIFISMSGSEQDYGASDVDIAEPRSSSSDLKVHFKVSGLSLDKTKLEDIEASVVEQFEIKAGPVQRQFVRTEVMSNTACIFIGLSRDSDAVEFFSRKEKLSESCDIEPVQIFKPFLEQEQRRGRSKKNDSPMQELDSPIESKPRRRSRSPRKSNALMVIACPPLQIKDSDVLQELSRLEVMEVPKIEYIFSNVKESEQTSNTGWCQN